MFGFLRARRNDSCYRRVYAGLCAFQHREFGIESLPFLSYESVFLYSLAIDAGRCDSPEASVVTCCRLRTKCQRLYPVEESVGRFCSSFGLLLASIKLRDDVRDDRSVLARLALWRLKSRIEAAYSFFVRLDSDFEDRVRSCIEQHLRSENIDQQQSLDEYAQPTGLGFGYLFGLFEGVLGRANVRRASLEQIGNSIGQAIINFDCAVDWPRDLRTGSFNPLPNQSACCQALANAQRNLSRAMWCCLDQLGNGATSASILSDSFRRVEQYRLARTQAGTMPRRTRKHPRQGDCDCACDAACCDGCDCGPIDVADPCCPGDCPLFECLCSRPPERTTKASAIEEIEPSMVGKTARTVGPLNPSGVILIDDEHLPARSELGWIDADTVVRIIRRESFGLVVRPESSDHT